MHFLFLGHHKLNFQSLKKQTSDKKLALCTPIGVRKTVIPMCSKRPNENGQKSLYQSRNGFIKKTAVDTLGFLFYKVAHCLYFTLGGENLAVFGHTLSGFYLLLHVIFAP